MEQSCLLSSTFGALTGRGLISGTIFDAYLMKGTLAAAGSHWSPVHADAALVWSGREDGDHPGHGISSAVGTISLSHNVTRH